MSHVYFTDRDLGKQFPRILADSGLSVERHMDLFRQDGTDEEWLEHCGENDRVAITHNSRIRYVPNQIAAIRRFKVRLLVVVGHATNALLAENFVKSLDKIELLIDGRRGPLIVKIYRPTPAEVRKSTNARGRAEVWFP